MSPGHRQLCNTSEVGHVVKNGCESAIVSGCQNMTIISAMWEGVGNVH